MKVFRGLLAAVTIVMVLFNFHGFALAASKSGGKTSMENAFYAIDNRSFLMLVREAEKFKKENPEANYQDFFRYIDRTSRKNPGDVVAQGYYDIYKGLTDAEKQLFWENPWKAYKAYLAARDAIGETTRRFGYSGHNDCTDAFRHAYWNALMVKRIDLDWAIRWATAHEQNPNQPEIEKQMDLYNNAKGREIAVNNPSASEPQLADKVDAARRSGVLVRISGNQLVPCR
ncbi:DUF6973 domain-containing protein [Brockia lithotrophica]|uniref:DUF6973 domain-containing protein n=1 Tax=Brockia lithotrophica TaxID=933949 RepID=A0A660L6S8_9BACL|nr:hypothetical protein [Brockia lithotrophica]RKQ88542.1 hypothetical protein C7438_0175 [Brockia lithotrophica]